MSKNKTSHIPKVMKMECKRCKYKFNLSNQIVEALMDLYKLNKFESLGITCKSCGNLIEDDLVEALGIKDKIKNKTRIQEKLTVLDSKFKPDDLSEEEERKKFLTIFTKPEFNIFEEYESLKCEAEKKEFKGTVSNFYFDYLQAMGIRTLNQLLNTDISILTKRAENTFFHPGPGKIYGINDVIVNKLGRELKGIGDYIPVSEKVKNELAKIGIHELGDCLNQSAKELLKVKGLGKKILVNINSALRKYHRRTLKNSEGF